MKLRAWIFIIIALLIVGWLSAQEATPDVAYRLHVPTAEEYINTIPVIWEVRSYAEPSLAQMDFDERLSKLLIDQFSQRYFDTADAHTLSDAYEQLNRGYNTWSNYSPYLDIVGWNIEIVQRYLAASAVELSDDGVVTFDQYQIDIEKYDFDSNGEFEWLMYVQRQDSSSTYTDYWTARRDPNLESGYAITYVPVPFSDSNFWPAQENSPWAGLAAPNFRDVNGDGIGEWITHTRTVEPSSNPQGFYETSYVLGWRDNRWNILTARSIEGEDGHSEVRALTPRTHIDYSHEFDQSWIFENTDQDEALELVLYQENTEQTFECTRIEQSLYDWDGEYYMLAQHSNRYTFSPGCLARIIFNASVQLRGWLRQFSNQLLAQVMPQTSPVSTSVSDSDYELLLAFNRLQRALSAQDMDIVTTELEQMLNDSRFQTVENNYLISVSRFYYALTLESLDQPDEVLEEYVAIFEAAPESAWGMLAGLHLVRVTAQG